MKGNEKRLTGYLLCGVFGTLRKYEETVADLGQYTDKINLCAVQYKVGHSKCRRHFDNYVNRIYIQPRQNLPPAW